MISFSSTNIASNWQSVGINPIYVPVLRSASYSIAAREFLTRIQLKNLDDVGG